MRASYVPLYYGQDGPLQAILVRPNFSVKDRFIDVVIVDREHLQKLGVGLRQHRVMARITHANVLGQALRNDDTYVVYVKPT